MGKIGDLGKKVVAEEEAKAQARRKAILDAPWGGPRISKHIEDIRSPADVAKDQRNYRKLQQADKDPELNTLIRHGTRPNRNDFTKDVVKQEQVTEDWFFDLTGRALTTPRGRRPGKPGYVKKR